MEDTSVSVYQWVSVYFLWHVALPRSGTDRSNLSGAKVMCFSQTESGNCVRSVIREQTSLSCFTSVKPCNLEITQQCV